MQCVNLKITLQIMLGVLDHVTRLHLLSTFNNSAISLYVRNSFPRQFSGIQSAIVGLPVVSSPIRLTTCHWYVHMTRVTHSKGSGLVNVICPYMVCYTLFGFTRCKSSQSPIKGSSTPARRWAKNLADVGKAFSPFSSWYRRTPHNSCSTQRRSPHFHTEIALVDSIRKK